jgi:hypothetical protein
MTDAGGSYYATGVGSAIMGRGAHVFLVDDPFGSMADARSEVEARRSMMVSRHGLQPPRTPRRHRAHQPSNAP